MEENQEIPGIAMNTRKIALCSPDKFVTIRELTGEDEDTLTLLRDQQDGSAINKFVAGVIVDGTITESVVKSWRVRDKYFILFEVMRLTYGDTFRFEYEFPDGAVGEFEENLLDYTFDFASGKDYPDDNPERIKAYPDNETEVTFELPSGKEVGFEYLTGELEAITLTGDVEDRSINDPLRDRNFFEKAGGQKQPITSFRVFSAKDMMIIRKKLEELDPEWQCIVRLPHPNDPKMLTPVSIFQIKDFFFRRLL